MTCYVHIFMQTMARCVVCTIPHQERPLLSRLRCGHLFCPTCIGEWCCYLAEDNNNPTCPLCRGDARMQELVPQRVVLNDDGTVRKSTMKPGFLSQLPGRKALPFKNTNRAVTTKRKRSADQLQTTGTAHSTYTQHTHTHPTCTQHIHTTHTHITHEHSTYTQHNTYTHHTCTQYIHTTHICTARTHSTYTQQHSTYAQHICTAHTQHIHTVCTVWV